MVVTTKRSTRSVPLEHHLPHFTDFTPVRILLHVSSCLTSSKHNKQLPFTLSNLWKLFTKSIRSRMTNMGAAVRGYLFIIIVQNQLDSANWTTVMDSLEIILGQCAKPSCVQDNIIQIFCTAHKIFHVVRFFMYLFNNALLSDCFVANVRQGTQCLEKMHRHAAYIILAKSSYSILSRVHHIYVGSAMVRVSW